MEHYAHKASRSKNKGGLDNLLFVVASAEAVPEELDGLISDITILFPWGSLLKAVASADGQFLESLKRITTKNATLRILFSLEPNIEQKIMASLGIKSLSSESLNDLKAAYAQHGFRMSWRMVSQCELKSFPSTWAKRLAFGRPRPVVEILCRVD